MKAKIGITPTYDSYTGRLQITPFYARAVEESGGIAYFLPYSRDVSVINELADTLDGIIFSGGSNVDPRLYGEEPAENSGEIEFERDPFELALYKAAVERDRSILGICRGCQLLAVAADGTLHQRLDSHMQTADRYVTSHKVNIVRDSPLFRILNADVTDVNSFHRQSVKATGSLKPAATGEDGEIEAVYMPGKRFHLGVQWHPERMYHTSTHAKLIFDSFISSCKA